MKIITTITMFLACVAAHAQSVTYNHDASVMNQFLVGETGAGHLTPDLYYDALHKSYRNSAMMTSKQMFRLQMMQALSKEETHAEVIDSILTDRVKVELKNVADRTPGVLDAAYMVEKSKIEKALAVFKGNIEKITLSGGTSAQYRQWLECYNAVYCGLQAVRDAYMPQGSRKEQYLAIYQDILRKNVEVCQVLDFLREQRELKRHPNKKVRPLPKTQVGRIAKHAHGRWKVALAGVTGYNNEHEETADERLQDLLENNGNEESAKKKGRRP